MTSLPQLVFTTLTIVMGNNCLDIFLDDTVERNSIISVGVVGKNIWVQHTPGLQLLLYLALAVKLPAVKASLHEVKDALHTLGHAVVHPTTRGHKLL